MAAAADGCTPRKHKDMATGNALQEPAAGEAPPPPGGRLPLGWRGSRAAARMRGRAAGQPRLAELLPALQVHEDAQRPVPAWARRGRPGGSRAHRGSPRRGPRRRVYPPRAARSTRTIRAPTRRRNPPFTLSHEAAHSGQIGLDKTTTTPTSSSSFPPSFCFVLIPFFFVFG